jgi:hypothetical protein
MHAPLIFCSTMHSINVQKIFKIVLAKAFDLKVRSSALPLSTRSFLFPSIVLSSVFGSSLAERFAPCLALRP